MVARETHWHGEVWYFLLHAILKTDSTELYIYIYIFPSLYNYKLYHLHGMYHKNQATTFHID